MTGPMPIASTRLQHDAATPRSASYDDIYHAADGVAEVHRVFMAPADLETRFARAASDTLTIGELGFGTGLNFAVLAETFSQRAPAGARLHFVSVEKHPIDEQDFAALARTRCTELPIYADLACHYPARLSGWHRRHFHNGRITLSVFYGDALTGYRSLVGRTSRLMAHWLLDGFAPDRNPEMWSEPLLQTISTLSASGATACSFSAAGAVRRGLQRVGFDVSKVDQLPHKRHSTLGRFRSTAASFKPPASVVVQGAGLAGSCVARALAERNIAVTLLDDPAQPATAIPTATLNPRLLADGSPQAAHRLRSYLYSTHWLARFDAVALGGVLQLPGGTNTEQRMAGVASRFDDSGAWLQPLGVESARASSGIPLRSGGLLLRDAGRVDIGALLRELRDHPAIESVRDTLVPAEPGTPRVLCAGAASNNEPGAYFLELLPVWGQIEQVRLSNGPELPLIGDGFLCPGDPLTGAGSTYEQTPWDPVTARRFNLERLEAWWASNVDATLHYQPVASVRGCRAVSSDRAPVVGPLVPSADMTAPDRWVSTGHGSHGTVSAPFAADCLAAELNGEFAITEPDEAACVHPTRFLERQARRGLRHGARAG